MKSSTFDKMKIDYSEVMKVNEQKVLFLKKILILV